MSGSWTLGPWGPPVPYGAGLEIIGSGISVCTILPATVTPPYDGTGQQKPERRLRANALDDAHLIAAAPDLAAACRMLVDSYQEATGAYGLGALYEAREAARAALAKARGDTREKE